VWPSVFEKHMAQICWVCSAQQIFFAFQANFIFATRKHIYIKPNKK